MATVAPKSSNYPDNLNSERLFRTLVESVTDYAIFVLDPKGYVVTWNPGAHRLKGYEADEIIGKHFSAFYPEVDKARGKPDFELKIATETGRFEDEGWRVRKDGSRFWANVVITRLIDEHGIMIGFGKITRDLTDRRQAEQRYRLLVEGVSDYAIFSLDKDGYVQSWNSGAQRIKGYTADEIIGKHFSTFYTPEDRRNGLPNVVLSTARQQGHWEGEGWRVRKDGTRFWSLVVVTAIRDEDGVVTGFSKVTRDMSDRKRLMDEIKRHAEELELRIAEREQTNAELEAFSYSVSHDLRAPLRAIEGFAVALREDYGDRLDETATDYLNEISKAAVRMNRLVQDLLDYSRLSRVEFALKPTAVLPVIQGILSEDIDREHVHVEVAPDIYVMAHAPALAQALTNLISNALKFCRKDEEPRVDVTAERNGDARVRIAVKDNGIGIAQQHQERIFNVFERLHQADEYPGTGIGLAIVKRSIERMNGNIGLISEEGKGSTFWIELPAAEPIDTKVVEAE